MMQFALEQGMIKDDLTAQGQDRRFRTWDENDIATFETRHAIGTKERLALGMPATMLVFRAELRKSSIL
jgi:hypothetical protein